ncbi:MAG: TraB/GumN family protein [Deltaproteobacteria bacterium]|nr:TraB/GumN family protein [Deltaproteobacteria bacterium]
MKWLAAVAALACACRASPPAPARGSAAAPAPVVAGSAARGSAAHDPWSQGDPWAVAGSADDPPSLMERHKLADAACPAVTGPYFFRVEKAGKTNYILGTRHVSVPLAKFPPIVRDALDAAKLAVFEVAPGDDSSTKRPDIDLPAAVGSADWAHYSELVGSEAAKMLAHSRPATAMITMMVEYEDISSTLDIEIEHAVKAKHIPTRGLETSQFQDDLLDELLDIRAFKTMIEQTKSRDELRQDSHDDLAEYCAGTDETPGTDEKNRKQMLAGGYTNEEIDHEDDVMVFQRNARWIPQLEQLFTDNGVFVAVGADHTIGDKGIISLLRARGFTITRLK